MRSVSFLQQSHRGLVPALVTAILAIACAAIFLREAAPTPPLVIAGLRLVLAGFLLWGIARARPGSGVAPGRESLLAGVLYAVHFGTWIASLWLTTLAASTTLVTASPVFLAIHGLWTGRDRPSPGLLGCLALATGGVALIAVGTDASATAPNPALGNALAVVGAIAMAGYLLLTRRLGERLDVTRFGMRATLSGGAILLGGAGLLGQLPVPASLSSLGWIALAAAVPQVLGHSLLTWAMKVTTPTVVGLATLGEPVVTTALGFWLYAERPGPWVLAGCALTLVAVVATLRVSRGTAAAPEPV